MWGYSPSSFRWLRVLFWICNKLHKNKRNKMNTNSKRMSQLCMHASWSTYCTRLLGNLVLITKCGYNEYFKIWCDAVFFFGEYAWWIQQNTMVKLYSLKGILIINFLEQPLETVYTHIGTPITISQHLYTKTSFFLDRGDIAALTAYVL